MSDALTRLKDTVAASNISKVAQKIGIPRCTLSLVVNDKYPADNKNILAKFELAYGGIECPHLNQQISREQCREYHQKKRPSNPIGLQHYRACLNCQHKGA